MLHANARPCSRSTHFPKAAPIHPLPSVQHLHCPVANVCAAMTQVAGRSSRTWITAMRSDPPGKEEDTRCCPTHLSGSITLSCDGCSHGAFGEVRFMAPWSNLPQAAACWTKKSCRRVPQKLQRVCTLWAADGKNGHVAGCRRFGDCCSAAGN